MFQTTVSFNTLRCFSSASVMRGSTGTPPRSRLQAIRTPPKSRSGGRENEAPGSDSETGERGSGPAIAESIRATSSTVRAIGPSTENGNQAARFGHVGTLPVEGRNPTTLQKLAGLRKEPPMSLPSASGSILQARATAAPPLLPPHVFVV